MDTKNIIIALLLGALVAVIGFGLYSSGLLWETTDKVGQEGARDLGVNSVPVAVLRTGSYALEGYGGSLSAQPSYRGEVFIAKTGEVYKLEWSIGGQVQRGVGILEDNILSVGYVDLTGGDIQDAGVVSYRVVKEGKLEGKWSSILAQETGREILTWQGSL